jgi:hypothetical protein
MRLSVRNRPEFDTCLDTGYSPRESIVLRYRHAFDYGKTEKETAVYKAWLQKTSIREGARILSLLHYRGVEIYLLDETSFMCTRTLKSIDGCVSMALCKSKGYDRVVFESGGNTGTALTEYGRRAGVDTFFFCPAENIFLLNSKTFATGRTHLIAVEDAASVKKAARLFSERNGVKRIPESNWRYMASMFRGCFILEHMLTNGTFDWLTQTISAAFGPIGIYRVFNAFAGQLGSPPRFMGIQQEGNCPMYRAWKSEAVEKEPEEKGAGGQLLTRVMYDVTPETYGTYQEFQGLLSSIRGALTTVNHSEFGALIERLFDGRTVFDLLRDKGIEISMKDGEVIEKTGLLALAGTLKEIDRGTIEPGSRVLCCLTSGVSDADNRAEPEYRMNHVETAIEDYSRLIFGR